MTDKAISPLRQRMIEDMEVRGFTACTQRGYIAAAARERLLLEAKQMYRRHGLDFRV